MITDGIADGRTDERTDGTDENYTSLRGYKYTFKLSADLHVNEYNHIWLPIVLGFMLIFSLKNNEEEVFYQLLRDGYICLYRYWKRVQNVTVEGNG